MNPKKEKKKSVLADLLTINDAAELLDLSKPTVVNLVKDGKLKGIKFGLRWRFKREDIDAFIEKLLS